MTIVTFAVSEFTDEWVTYRDPNRPEFTIRRTREVHEMFRHGPPTLGQLVDFEEHDAVEGLDYGSFPAYFYLIPKGTNDTRGVHEEVGRRIHRKAVQGGDDGPDERSLFEVDHGDGD